LRPDSVDADTPKKRESTAERLPYGRRKRRPESAQMRM
jgi:hypothetical protein